MNIARKLTFAAVLLLVTAFYAHAQSYVGLCADSWDCDRTLAEQRGKSEITFGWLNETFNDRGGRCPCLKRLMADPRPKIFRVHLFNATCFVSRGRTCGPHELFAGETIASANEKLRTRNPSMIRKLRHRAKLARRRLDAVGAFDQKNTCYVSPFLESPFSRGANAVGLETVLQWFQECGTVINPINADFCDTRTGLSTLCELHGDRPKFPVGRDCLADLDGTAFGAADVAGWLRRSSYCHLRLTWTPEYNCLAPSHPSFVPPLERECR